MPEREPVSDAIPAAVCDHADETQRAERHQYPARRRRRQKRRFMLPGFFFYVLWEELQQAFSWIKVCSCPDHEKQQGAHDQRQKHRNRHYAHPSAPGSLSVRRAFIVVSRPCLSWHTSSQAAIRPSYDLIRYLSSGFLATQCRRKKPRFSPDSITSPALLQSSRTSSVPYT